MARTLTMLMSTMTIGALGFAAPAPADPAPAAPAPAVDGGAFLHALDDAGITYADPDQAITAAKAVCGLVDRGESGLQVIVDLKNSNPGFTTDGAHAFAAIASQTYCPHHLTKR